MEHISSLETLMAKDAIRDLVFTYCRAIDRRDYAALKTLYHDGAFDDHGDFFKGSGHDFVAWLPNILDTFSVTSHQVLNHLIKVQGNYAEGEVYVQAYHLGKGEDGSPLDIVLGGRFLDQYEKRGDVWKISKRMIVADWESITPSSNLAAVAGRESATVTGGHGENDPATGFFRLIR